MSPRRAHLLAIDQGSQSTKVSIVDERGHVVVEASRPLRPYDTSVRGQAVHPDDDLWDSLVHTCRDTLARYQGDARELVGVGLCTIRCCRALLDPDGRLTEPVLSWMDRRVNQPLAAPGGRTRYVTTSSGYVGHRLTGERVDTAANQEGVWPFDLESGSWSSDPASYAETGMPRELLFDLVAPGERIGVITPAAADATGLPAGLPVFATANDKAVEALGCGLRDDQGVVLSLGTYIAAMAVGSSARSRHDDYWVNAAAEPGRLLYESKGIRRGMWTVSWFRDLIAQSPGTAGELEEALNAEAAGVPPGSNGLVAILNWLAPDDAAYRRGALLGFDGSQGRAHVYRAILEGIALTMRQHTVAMERALGREHQTLLVSRGGSRSTVMMQIVADVFGRPAHRMAVPDAAGIGAAICAAVGAGVHPDFATAAHAMTRVADTFAPSPESVRAYAGLSETYADLTDLTDPVFRRMDNPS